MSQLSPSHRVPAPAVLLVEPDPGIGELLRHVLEEEELLVLDVSDAIGAAPTVRPCLAMIDLHPLERDPVEVVRKLLTRYGSALPVLFLTTDQRIMQAVRSLPHSQVLAMPFAVDDFLAAVWQLIMAATRVAHPARDEDPDPVEGEGLELVDV